jgi:hypothetical protein
MSKLIAGGLSAGVVLLWWPRFFPHDSAGTWVARGIAWTLLAEILVVALSPLEHVLRARVAATGPVTCARSSPAARGCATGSRSASPRPPSACR